jgi:hypothetical protein
MKRIVTIRTYKRILTFVSYANNRNLFKELFRVVRDKMNGPELKNYTVKISRTK